MKKYIIQLLCLHKWPPVHFAIDEYKKEYTCQKCNKVKVVYIGDKPEYVNILPTDYYEYKAKHNK